MPLNDRDYVRGNHPPACTCASCVSARLRGRRVSQRRGGAASPPARPSGSSGRTPPPNRRNPRNRGNSGYQPPRRKGKWGKRLVKLAALVVVILLVYGGWGVWEDYREHNYFEPQRAVDISLARWQGIPGAVEGQVSRLVNPTDSAPAESTPSPGTPPVKPDIAPPEMSAKEPAREIATAPTLVPPASAEATPRPTATPTTIPTLTPTPQPTATPTPTPTVIPTPAPTLTPTPPPGYIDLQGVQSLEETNSFAARTIRTLPWVNDGVEPHERRNAQALIDLAISERSLFSAVADAPFLSTLDNDDVEFIGFLVGLDKPSLERATGHRYFRDGITDEEATAVVNSGNLASIGILATLTDMRVYMLGLINEARLSAGLEEVELGINDAAQLHAEDKLKNNYSSHWGLDGLTPYMRYTLAGGTNYEAENSSGPAFLRPGVRYVTKSHKDLLDESHSGLMQSPGHRKNILNKWHRRVNLGIACNQYTCSVVQQFEGDYVQFSEKPSISNGILSFAGDLTGGFTFKSAQVWYDQLPHPLTLGQLDTTYSYGVGQKPVTFIRKPLGPLSYYTSDYASFSWQSGIDPYDVDPKTPRNTSPFRLRPPVIPQSRLVPWTTADFWHVSLGSFGIKVDISATVTDQGPGVYTVLIWGTKGNEDVALTKYSIFVE